MIEIFEKILNEKKCHELCRTHKFIQRSSSKLKGAEFIKTMILPSEGLSEDSLIGLCSRLRKFNSDANLSPQALCERINRYSHQLMKAVFGNILQFIRSITMRRCPKLAKVLDKFTNVLIEDSTVAQLNEQLNDEFVGTNRGGSGAKSQVKIDVIYELMKGQIIDASLHSANVPDQGLAHRILSHVNPGDLILRDLGYFVLSSLKGIMKMQAYVLSRLQPNVKVYLREGDEEPLDIGKYLSKFHKHNNIVDMNIWLGEERVPMRLVLYRLPRDVVNKKLRNAHQRAKDTGRTLSKGKKAALQFAMFVTNVPKDMLSAEIIGTVYRLRWEIELVFKRWKSQLKIDYLKGINKNRIECLIWSRLCTILIIELVRGYLSGIIPIDGRELSEVKLIDYLLRNNNFCSAIGKNKIEDFLEEMEKDIQRMLLKDKRRRKTLREMIFTEESYYGMQSVENELVA